MHLLQHCLLRPWSFQMGNMALVSPATNALRCSWRALSRLFCLLSEPQQPVCFSPESPVSGRRNNTSSKPIMALWKRYPCQLLSQQTICSRATTSSVVAIRNLWLCNLKVGYWGLYSPDLSYLASIRPCSHWNKDKNRALPTVSKTGKTKANQSFRPFHLERRNREPSKFNPKWHKSGNFHRKFQHSHSSKAGNEARDRLAWWHAQGFLTQGAG